MSSDGAGYLANREAGIGALPPDALGELRPQAASDGGLCVSGGQMTRRFDGVGRPSNAEIKRQQREFRRLVVAGVDIEEAAREARIKPERALAVLTPIVRSLLARAA